MSMRTVSIGGSGVRTIQVSNQNPFFIFAGPCQIESRDHTMFMAERLVELTEKLGIGFVYKSSFDKANRTSLKGARGIGIDAGLKILQDVRNTFQCPVITDVHNEQQCAVVADVVDVLQIPAFLCRQTDILIAAARTGKPLHVKKGQFLAPWDMKNVADKIVDSGNENILLCERGVTFGYNTLVVDMRGIPEMQKTGFPVVFDATHSVQQPGGAGTASGGQRTYVTTLARAAVAVGVAGVFLETHDNPDVAPSDGPNMVPLSKLENLLIQLQQIDAIAKQYPNTLT